MIKSNFKTDFLKWPLFSGQPNTNAADIYIYQYIYIYRNTSKYFVFTHKKVIVILKNPNRVRHMTIIFS